jgi:hypothetical protein
MHYSLVIVLHYSSQNSTSSEYHIHCAKKKQKSTSPEIGMLECDCGRGEAEDGRQEIEEGEKPIEKLFHWANPATLLWRPQQSQKLFRVFDDLFRPGKHRVREQRLRLTPCWSNSRQRDLGNTSEGYAQSWFQSHHDHSLSLASHSSQNTGQD